MRTIYSFVLVAFCSALLGTTALEGESCYKWNGCTYIACTTRYSTDCGPAYFYTCQVEDCSAPFYGDLWCYANPGDQYTDTCLWGATACAGMTFCPGGW